MMEDCAREDPPLAAPEKVMLEAFLNYHRATLLCKVDGVTDEDLRRPGTPSGLTLLGLVKHLADVERSWFREVFAGEDLAHLWSDEDPGRYWRVEPGETSEQILAFYREEVARSREITRGAMLDEVARQPDYQSRGFTLRWIMLHMIEETARHNGHADILREVIDGQTGE